MCPRVLNDAYKENTFTSAQWLQKCVIDLSPVTKSQGVKMCSTVLKCLKSFVLKWGVARQVLHTRAVTALSNSYNIIKELVPAVQNCSVEINKFWQFATAGIWVFSYSNLSKLLDFIKSSVLLDVTTLTLNYFFSWKLRIDFFLFLNNLGL